jgi:NAD(P)H-flavin reductase
MVIDPMTPVPARVRDVHRESRDVVTFELETKSLRNRAFLPGQFNMLYSFGVGEVPVSMSGDPSRNDVVVHTVKAVGAVTEALCRVRRNDVIGVRGPFGMPWSMDLPKGSDLLLIAGGLGLAPLRPVVYAALQHRQQFGSLSLLVGARTPADLLFQPELGQWQQSGEITIRISVDHASPEWKGQVGVVPSLLSDIPLAPERTVAFVCGPEVMMRFSVRELERRGVPDSAIYLSMERNMKCAVGYCGHCQFGQSFVCKDGPVFPYDRIRSRFWLREF